MTGHDLWGDAVGAYVLGALEPDERSAFEEHLRSCDRCAAEVVDLAPLPALLARVSLEDVGSAPAPGPGLEAVVAAVQDDVDRLDRSRRRWRTVAVVAVAALLCGVAGLVVQGAGGDEEGPLADRGEALVVAAPSGVVGEVVADPRSWGTYVHLRVEGLPERDRYVLWVVDRSGGWHHAGTWGPTEARGARLGASSHVTLGEIEQVVVTSTTRSDQLLSARPAATPVPSGQSSRE